MGYYIPNNIPLNKRENVKEIEKPTKLSDVSENEAIICAVDNVLFKAYAFAYSQKELEEFLRPDGRVKVWYKMPLDKAKELSGYPK